MKLVENLILQQVYYLPQPDAQQDDSENEGASHRAPVGRHDQANDHRQKHDCPGPEEAKRPCFYAATEDAQAIEKPHISYEQHHTDPNEDGGPHDGAERVTTPIPIRIITNPTTRAGRAHSAGG